MAYNGLVQSWLWPGKHKLRACFTQEPMTCLAKMIDTVSFISYIKIGCNARQHCVDSYRFCSILEYEQNALLGDANVIDTS